MIEQLTAAQMAVRVGISERSIQRWMQEGRLQAKRIEDSSLYEVESSDLERLRLRGHREEESRLQAVERLARELDGKMEGTILVQEEQFTVLERRLTDQAEQIALLEAVRSLLTSQLQQMTDIQEKERRDRELLHAQLDQLYRQFESLEKRTSEEELEAVQLHLNALEAQLERFSVRLTHLEEQPTLTRTGPLVSAAEHSGTETHATGTAPRTRSAERSSAAIMPNAEGIVPAVQFAEAHGISKNAAKSAFKRQNIRTTQIVKPGPHYLDEEQRRAALTYWQEHHTPGFHQC